MGCTPSSSVPPKPGGEEMTEEDKEKYHREIMADKNIVNSMVDAERKERTIKKLLLLGTGSSGKSTLFKSLRSINEGGFQESELAESRHVIRQNCVAGILTVLKKSQELYDEDSNRYKECLVDMDDNIIQAITTIVSFGNESFTEALVYSEVYELGRAIAMLWSLPSVQATFMNRGNKYSFPDNMDYFFAKVRTIMTESYMPNDQDLLKARVRTTGMIEYVYEAEDNVFNIYDVGGQRNERKKWIHSFENVAAVLFVTALNHYHAVLFEDEKKNAMHEAVELFTEICNSKWFRKSEMILFLNKVDLYRLKIRNQISLSECFSPEAGFLLMDPRTDVYWDGPDYEPLENLEEDEKYFEICVAAGIDYITRVFNDRNKIALRVVFCHTTCATDSDAVQKVFWDVQNMVIRSNLRRGGLMA